ncbi:metallophosphoesterase family protein [Timonella sp. A28]|uniref:metallophosphoesterase family protein n=1 Tax=Timonella sp. A28 TaxID=3442640 RepID=UPI003EBDF3C1
MPKTMGDNDQEPKTTRLRDIFRTVVDASRHAFARTQNLRFAVSRWARYPQDGTTPPRLLRYVLVGLAIVMVSTVFGVVTARAQANFGPHDATYEVTVNSTITVDAGPLGTLEVDSPLPLGLGVTAVIGEIPASLTSLSPNQNLGALVQDVDSYMQFFAAPEETLDLVAHLLIQDAVQRALLAAGTLTFLIGATAFVLGRSRRKELSYRLARRTWLIASAYVASVALITVSVVQYDSHHVQGEQGQVAAVFDGTALQGARLTGRLAGVIDVYGAQLIGVYEENENFYATADAALRDAFEARTEADKEIAAQQAQFLQESDPTHDDEYVTMLLVSDLHCNVGMSPLITTAARATGTSIVVNGGDTTINGTDIERFCMQSFANAVPDGAVMVQADGNHDSQLTGEQAKAAGVIVLDGKIKEVKGVRFLGDSDPRETRIGQGSTLVNGETYAQAGSRLTEVACAAQKRPDILLIHTPAVGNPVMESGCVPYQISGHYHKRIGPVYAGQGVRYGNSTTAGAMEGKASIGPLNGTAEMTVLRYNPETQSIVDMQIIAVTPDATATVGPRVRFPHPDDGARSVHILDDGLKALTVIPPTQQEQEQEPAPETDTTSPEEETRE